MKKEIGMKFIQKSTGTIYQIVSAEMDSKGRMLILREGNLLEVPEDSKSWDLFEEIKQ